MKSASKTGSSTSFSAACTTRSATVGMPRLRTFPDPPGFGILRSRTGRGRNEPSLRAARRSCRNPGAPIRSSTSMTVRPSTPGVRAPWFPATRANAIVSVAGSCTRLNRSSNRRPGSAVAQWCSLVCISSTRTRELGSSLFSEVSSGIAVPPSMFSAAALPHVTGFPGLGVLRRLRPARSVRLSVRLSTFLIWKLRNVEL